MYFLSSKIQKLRSHKKCARYEPALFSNAYMSMFWFLIIEVCSTS